jgi:hypothetical protein
MLYVFLEAGSTPSEKKPISSAFFVTSTGPDGDADGFADADAEADGAAEGEGDGTAEGLGAADEAAAEGVPEGPVVPLQENRVRIIRIARSTATAFFMNILL